jgi:hypothetical protein
VSVLQIEYVPDVILQKIQIKKFDSETVHFVITFKRSLKIVIQERTDLIFLRLVSYNSRIVQGPNSERDMHRVDRVLGFFSSRRGVGGGGVLSTDEGTDTVVL